MANSQTGRDRSRWAILALITVSHIIGAVAQYGADRCFVLVAIAGEPASDELASLAAELLRGPKVLFCDGVVSAAGIPCREMLWGLFRALAREGNTVILAERTIPERWALAAGDGADVGPFRVYRLPVPVPGANRIYELKH